MGKAITSLFRMLNQLCLIYEPSIDAVSIAFICTLSAKNFMHTVVCVCCWSQLTEGDQELYKNFPLVVSDRWQQEIAETVFDAINQDADKMEQKRRQKERIDESEDCKQL